MHYSTSPQVVLSAACAVATGAPQLLAHPYAGYGYGLGAIHAVPTVAKQTVTYKTAAFEPVEADTPADAQLIALKETEHSFDTLVPGPVQYHHTPAVYGYGLHGGLIAAPAVETVELPKIELPSVYAGHGLLGGYGYPYGYGLGLHGLPVVAAAAAEE